MDLREVGYDDRDWINLAQDRDQWRAYVREAMNLRVPYKPPVKGLDRPAGCWPHAHMSKQRWTIIQPEWKYRVVSTMIPPAVIAGIHNRISLPIVAPQVHHYAGWAPVPYTGRNFMRKCLPHEDSNQRAFRNASPRQDALDRDATAWDP
ncbi:hypothetical protein ANN_23512 [Periplaneta americana]|uniref:Uncharacterized protein n=1 Tax=Periplaneta americana TaxID=6978 RepID=A0ABQ8SND2_PERAM|nr:hypothetical protein ANN_23512 [Periplaneta americana]